MYKYILGVAIAKFSAGCIVGYIYSYYIVALVSAISLSLIIGGVIGYYIASNSNIYTTYIKHKTGLISE
ncbi:MAG: hypothetical protein ABH884_03225 [Candidatus Komeilibacteria bacterium]